LEKYAMKFGALVLCLLGFAISGDAVFAQALNADDVKWINQCIADNKGGASDAIIRKYCVCMNEKMDNNETRSITQWEKANPAARRACDRESGWR
jgi:hypothetical protein